MCCYACGSGVPCWHRSEGWQAGNQRRTCSCCDSHLIRVSWTSCCGCIQGRGACSLWWRISPKRYWTIGKREYEQKQLIYVLSKMFWSFTLSDNPHTLVMCACAVMRCVCVHLWTIWLTHTWNMNYLRCSRLLLLLAQKLLPFAAQICMKNLQIFMKYSYSYSSTGSRFLQLPACADLFFFTPLHFPLIPHVVSGATACHMNYGRHLLVLHVPALVHQVQFSVDLKFEPQTLCSLWLLVSFPSRLQTCIAILEWFDTHKSNPTLK